MVINNTTTNILISATLLIPDFSVGSENQSKWDIAFKILSLLVSMGKTLSRKVAYIYLLPQVLESVQLNRSCPKKMFIKTL